jgi:hypothetical protein
MAYKNIILKGDPLPKEEALKASNDITPGMACQVDASGIFPSTANQTNLLAAIEFGMDGRGVTDDYDEDGEQVRYVAPRKGDELALLIGTSQNLAIGAELAIKAGGTFIAAASNPAVARVKEAVDNYHWYSTRSLRSNLRSGKNETKITSNGMITPATNGAIQGMGGTIGERLLRNNMELHSPGMRRNSLLRKDEWLALDSALVGLRPKTINGIFDLMVRGLVYPLGNIGVVIAEWERIYDVQDAEFSMTPETQALEDTLSFDSESVPVPIIHKDFRYELRRLTAARNNGTQLDTTHQEYAGTKVWEAIEGMLFNGVTMKLGTRQIYGYTSYPHRLLVV